MIRTIEQAVGLSLPEVTVRKAAHVFLYLVLGMLIIGLIRRLVTKQNRVVAISLVIVVLYAISDELHQHFVPGRSGQISDVALDTAAGLLGVLTYQVYGCRWLRRHDADL